MKHLRNDQEAEVWTRFACAAISHGWRLTGDSKSGSYTKSWSETADDMLEEFRKRTP